MSHPDNTALDVALDRYGHLPIHSMKMTRTNDRALVTLTFFTLDDYAAACRIHSKKPHDGGRLTSRGDHRIHDHLDRDDVLLEHVCWPSHECWGGTRTKAESPCAEPDSASAVRASGGQKWENGATTERPPGGALTPSIPGASPTTEESTDA